MTHAVVLASLIKWAGVETDDTYLQELKGHDVYVYLRKSEGFANDFLDMHDDKIEMRSALLSDYLIQRIFTAKQILDGCYEIATSSTRRKKDRAHRRLSGELIKS